MSLEPDDTIEIWFTQKGKKGTVRGRVAGFIIGDSKQPDYILIKMYGKFSKYILRANVENIHIQSWNAGDLSQRVTKDKSSHFKALGDILHLLDSDYFQYDNSAGIHLNDLSTLPQLPSLMFFSRRVKHPEVNYGIVPNTT